MTRIRKKLRRKIIPFLLCAVMAFAGREVYINGTGQGTAEAEIPEHSGQVVVEINGNQPFFKEEEVTTDAFESYSELDFLGRCGVAYANVCQELMPTEAREEIGMIKPSGWKQEKYPGIVDSAPPYLYNRCHLIGFQLSGENANEKNLITGTRYFNVEGMLPFENMVAEYVRETDHHVLYRVTPVFEEYNLLAKGVLMEAYSVEDSGEGVQFCVFVYNVQPGVEIDYRTGESFVDEDYSKAVSILAPIYDIIKKMIN